MRKGGGKKSPFPESGGIRHGKDKAIAQEGDGGKRRTEHRKRGNVRKTYLEKKKKQRYVPKRTFPWKKKPRFQI